MAFEKDAEGVADRGSRDAAPASQVFTPSGATDIVIRSNLSINPTLIE